MINDFFILDDYVDFAEVRRIVDMHIADNTIKKLLENALAWEGASAREMTPMIEDISNFIFIEDQPCKVDAIFIPGGSHPEQPEYAAQLYKEGFAPILIPSGGVSVTMERFAGPRSKRDIYNEDYKTECDFLTDVLRKNGVPKSAIVEENQAGHTRENAFFSRNVADAHHLNIQSAIIVCKAFHARRCFMLYQLAFPETKIYVCPVVCKGITRHNWYTTENGIDRVLGELERCDNQFAADMKEYLK